MKIKACFIIILCTLITACAGMEVRNQVEKLDYTLREYGADLRWGRANFAYAYHVNRDGERADFDLERMENFSVTDFRPVNPVVNEDATEATVPVEIDYYDEQYGTLKKIKYSQVWWYQEESKKWFTESAFPDFK